MDSNKTKTDLATRVALLYYNDNMSQNDIGRSLGISRSYVSQLLTFAKASGIVKISISAGDNYLNELSFSRKFGLKQSFILPSNSPEFSDSEFGKFCAPYAMRLIRNSRRIGVNLGESVKKVISSISREDVGDASPELVSQIMGGCLTTEQGGFGAIPNELVFNLGQLLGCGCQYLNAPAFISNAAARDMMIQESGIKSIMDAWNTLDIVLMGIGHAGVGMISDDLPDEYKHAIRSSGAVADINLNFFDINGTCIKLFEEHKVTMTADMIKKINMKVVFAYGENKAQAILAGLRANMIDVLFTDSLAAARVMALSENE